MGRHDILKTLKTELENFINLCSSLDKKVNSGEISGFESHFIINSITNNRPESKYILDLNQKIKSINPQTSRNHKYNRFLIKNIAFSTLIISMLITGILLSTGQGMNSFFIFENEKGNAAAGHISIEDSIKYNSSGSTAENITLMSISHTEKTGLENKGQGAG